MLLNKQAIKQAAREQGKILTKEAVSMIDSTVALLISRGAALAGGQRTITAVEISLAKTHIAGGA